MSQSGQKFEISVLDQLRRHTTVVADTGDFQALKSLQSTDATTNPSLILQTSRMSHYSHLLDEAIRCAKTDGNDTESVIVRSLDHLFVLFGIELLNIVPGRVSTEVDARLSFDVQAQIAKALRLVQLYEARGVSRDRVLIKLASTWEGICAAKILESEHNIRCNLTLLFSFCQAVACAEANVTLISPFVGRIFDWHIKNGNKKSFSRNDDPGVLSVVNIYNYYKKFDCKTVIMGASFRNTDQIKGLIGCDLLTISPKLLQTLADDFENVSVQISVAKAKTQQVDRCTLNEKQFRWLLNEDQMSTEKLSEGIRNFAADSRTLEKMVAMRLKMENANGVV